MAIISALDADTAQVLRSKLEALEGIERVVIDEMTSTVLMHCGPDCTAASLRPQIDSILTAVGADTQAIKVVLLTDIAARERVKFKGVERIEEHRGHYVRVRVGLEWDGEVHYGEALGEAGELIELRTAAVASLNALERVRGEPLGIKLVGVKQIKAFDTEMMFVALYRSMPNPQRLVGSVPTGNDPRRAAAVAVLNGLNRILGNYLTVR